MSLRLRLDRLIPMAVLCALFYQGKKGFSAKMQQLTAAGPSWQTKQKLGTVALQVRRLLAGEEDVANLDEEELSRIVSGSLRGDSRRDAWGKPLRLSKKGYLVTLRSGGADKKFGTGDDIIERINLGDY